MQLQWKLMVAAPIAVSVFTACEGSVDPTVSPTDFVTAHANDAHSIVAAVQEVTAGVGILADIDGGADPATLASFDELLSKAQSTFDGVNKVLLEAPKPKGVESSEVEMWSATDKLSSAMKSARAFVDDQKPSQLADYKKYWDTGRAWWNQAVTPIWQAANMPAPTVNNAPSAPPVS